MEPFDQAWLGCCPSGRIPSDDNGILTHNSNDVMRSAVGLTQAASHWKQMWTHAPKRRECLLFKITWPHISLRNARFIFSHAVVWLLLPDRDTFHRCFDLSFHNSNGRVKIDHSPKRTFADTCLSKSIMEPVYISKPCFEHMVKCEFHDVTAHITECVSTVKWAQNVFS